MANYSSASGEGTFKNNPDNPEDVWTPELRQLFVEAINRRFSDSTYSTEINDYSPELDYYNFIGTGRWAYSSNLEALDRWFLEKELTPGEAMLLEVMKNGNLTVELSYSDEEMGTHTLYDAQGVIKSNGKTLEYIEETRTDYDWTVENLINEAGYDWDCSDVRELLLEKFYEDYEVVAFADNPDDGTMVRLGHVSDSDDLEFDDLDPFDENGNIDEMIEKIEENGKYAVYSKKEQKVVSPATDLETVQEWLYRFGWYDENWTPWISDSK